MDALPGRTCPSCARSRPGHPVRCIRVGEIGDWDISRGTMPDADPDKPRDIILSLEDLGVFYGRKQVVFDVTFDVGKAEVVALVGESGSGKTTISRCVGGLHKEWTGEIEFEGTQLGHGSRKPQRRRPQADPVHLPEPLPLAEPAADDRADRQAADGAVRHRRAARPPPSGWSSCSTRWRSARPC